MCEWMSREMGGEVDGQMDEQLVVKGCMDGWVVGFMGIWIFKSICRWIDG